MKAKNVHVGDVYAVKVSGAIADVRVDAARPSGGWVGTNVGTGRQIVLRTAARLRFNVTLRDAAKAFYERRAAGLPDESPLDRTTIAGDYDGSEYAAPKLPAPPPSKRGWY
jgi:hypothetical protein